MKPTDLLAGILAVIVIGASFVYPAFAQDAVVVSPGDTIVSVAPWYDMLVSGITVVVGSAVTVAIAVVGNLLTKWFGVKIDDQLKNTLHSAAVTGITSAIERWGKPLREANIDVRNKIVREAVDWMATTGAPKAIEKFGLSEEELTTLALSKLKLVGLGSDQNWLLTGQRPSGEQTPLTP